MTGAAGAPTALRSGELAWSGVDTALYIGDGDDGNGNATSVIPVGGPTAYRKHFVSVSAAINTSTIKVGEYVETLGYNAAGDGGRATYIKVSAGTGVADGVEYIDFIAGTGQLRLLHVGTIAAEQAGAVDGTEASAAIQAAWDALVAWKDAQADPDIAHITLKHSSTCTLQNQVQFRRASDSTRVLAANIDFTESHLTAVAGGDLSSSNAMFLVRLRGTQHWGYMNGGKFAAIMDMNGMSGSRSYGGRFLHGKGNIVTVRGASGTFNWYNPHIREYEQTDAEFNTDANFTATGFSVEDGDFLVMGANILFCGKCIHIDAAAVQVHFINGHFVNGNPNYDGVTVFGRDNPVLIENRATRENHFDNCYFDNGIVHDYGGTMQVKGGHYVHNNRAVITGSKVRVYPTSAGQTTMPDGYWENVSGVGSIDFVADGANTWAGDMSGIAAQHTRMDAVNTSIGASGTRHRLHLDGEGPSEWHYTPQGAIEYHYKTGTNLLQMQIDPTAREYVMRDLQTLRVRNTGGDSELLFGGGNVGIRESNGNGGRLEIVTGSGAGSDGLAWYFQPDGDLLPQGNGTEDIGQASQRVGTGYFTAVNSLSATIGAGETSDIPLTLNSADPVVMLALVDSTTTAAGYVAYGATGDHALIRAGNADRVRVDSGGNVGVGVTNTTPGARLHVKASANIQLKLESDGPSQHARMVFSPSGSEKWNVGANHTSGEFTWFDVGTSSTPVKLAVGAPTDSLQMLADGTVQTGGEAVVGSYLRVNGGLKFGDMPVDTIAGGVLTPTHRASRVRSEGGAATDDLDTIATTNAVNGDVIIISTGDNAEDITVKHNVGNIKCGADFTLDNIHDTAMFVLMSGNWRLVSFQSNA